MKRSTLIVLHIVVILGLLLVWHHANSADASRVAVHAAVVPAFKRSHDASLWLLSLAAAADVYTTERGLHRGCHEANPLYGQHPSDMDLVAVHAIPLVGIVWYYDTHDAPAWPLVAGTAVMAATAIHNATIHCGRYR